MSKILSIDIGAGTMDILFFDTDSELHYKAVVISPVRTIAKRILSAEGKLLITGGEMGGGAVSQAIRQRAAKEELIISEAAAMTLSHDLDRVKAMGLKVVPETETVNLAESSDYTVVELSDLELNRIQTIVSGFGIDFEFDVVGICIQDHGLAPPGTSHLDYRHNHFQTILDDNPTPDALLYHIDEIPEDMPRLRSAGNNAGKLPANSIYLMDSGMAAILGATLDPGVRECKHSIVLDVATSHTVAACFEEDELCGFVEYHTKDIEVSRTDRLLKELANGELEHAQILAEGGHGAYTRRAIGFDSVGIILATGPRRSILSGSSLDIIAGAPLGDNMMTGTTGLLEAISRREGLGKLAYT
jgi:uncharacterized protein (DUF1786 family)